MSSKLRRLAKARLGAVSLADWRLFFQAWGWLLVFDLALRARPFRRVQALAETAARAAPADPQAAAARCLLAVERARHYHLYPMTCLRRSLTLQKLLGQQGLRATLKIGVQKKDGTLAAHAWVEVDGKVIGERGAVERRYAEIFGKEPRENNERA